jgi:hypothetical protein
MGVSRPFKPDTRIARASHAPRESRNCSFVDQQSLPNGCAIDDRFSDVQLYNWAPEAASGNMLSPREICCHCTIGNVRLEGKMSRLRRNWPGRGRHPVVRLRPQIRLNAPQLLNRTILGHFFAVLSTHRTQSKMSLHLRAVVRRSCSLAPGLEISLGPCSIRSRMEGSPGADDIIMLVGH